jgi:hypothetical protein
VHLTRLHPHGLVLHLSAHFGNHRAARVGQRRKIRPAPRSWAMNPILMVRIFEALKKPLGNSILQTDIDSSLSANFSLFTIAAFYIHTIACRFALSDKLNTVDANLCGRMNWTWLVVCNSSESRWR